jgi:predicted nucleotidyltransferase
MEQLTLERTFSMPLTLQTVLTEYLHKLLHLYGGHLKRVILYGSYARGDYTMDSDLDIMILVDLDEDEIKQYGEALSDFTFDTNLEKDLLLMPIVKNVEHFKYWESAYPFYKNVGQEGISLYAT